MSGGFGELANHAVERTRAESSSTASALAAQRRC